MLGVPADKIIKESNSQNTYENALFGLTVLNKIDHEANKVGVCCQAFHTRRVQMTFSSLAPKKKVLVFPADTQGITKDNWHESEYGRKRVFGELERCGKYFPMSPLEDEQ